MKTPTNPDMLEKYYHSRGAAACNEGRFDQAIRFFRKALVLDDQAYTRSHLSIAYEGEGDDKRALEEITKAIDLDPSNPEYYLRRSAIWRRWGDSDRADGDYGKALSIDANCARAGEIREALRAIEKAFAYSEAGEGLEISAVQDEGLRAILREIAASREERRQAIENRSCPVACLAYCCHFSKELALHGVLIGPWKLRAIREHLMGRGLQEQDFLQKRVIREEDLRLCLIPPNLVMTVKGERVIFYPKRTGKRIGPDLARNLPAGRGYDRIGWITEESRACAFLVDGRCAIHDLADEPALPACKEFLCLTGFVFLVLAHLGLVNEERIRSIDMEESNSLAVEAAVLVAKRLYRNERLVGLKTGLDETIREAAEADRRGEAAIREKLIKRYRRTERRYASCLSRQILLLEKDIGAIFHGG